MRTEQTIKLSEITFDPKVYPRKTHDPTLVQKYTETMESIEAQNNLICLSKNNKLIDGRHRHLAYQTLFLDDPDHEIRIYVYPVSDDADVFDLAAELNADFGWQMTDDDKRATAIKMYQQYGRTQEQVAKRLKIGIGKVNAWLKSIFDAERKEKKDKILNLWLSCHKNSDISHALDVSSAFVTKVLQDFSINFHGKDFEVFRNFEPKIYTVWNFSKSTNKVKHFGNIPPEIIDNLLYYYTKPFDVIFDPFGGGGSTIDKCIERKRRYYVSDLTPIPARPDIRQWDITKGLPDDLPVPDLVFLDPPYWRQAEKKYSEKDTDLGNVDIEKFLKDIGDIAKNSKRKWGSNRPDARLAIIIGPFYRDGEYVDLPLLCAQAIGKYLQLIERIQVPYSTEIVGGDDVNKAKDDKRMIHLLRDLMVFKK